MNVQGIPMQHVYAKAVQQERGSEAEDEVQEELPYLGDYA
jgi:hypothetical protein